MKLIASMTILTTLLSTTALASHTTNSPWTGSNANLGYNLNTGSTNTQNLSVGANAQYTALKWAQTLNLSYQMAYTDHVQTKSIFNGTENVNYYFSADKKTFMAGNVNVISDITSDYRYTIVGSAMYGRTLYNTKRTNWDVQAGPGMRYNAPTEGVAPYTRPVAVLLSNISIGLNHWGTLTENFRYEYGKPYNYLQTTTNLVNNLTGHLALQLSFQLNHYSQLPLLKKISALTSTTTTASIVYNY